MNTNTLIDVLIKQLKHHLFSMIKFTKNIFISFFQTENFQPFKN